MNMNPASPKEILDLARNFMESRILLSGAELGLFTLLSSTPLTAKEVAARITWRIEPRIDRIVSTWPSNFDCAKGARLGMQADDNFDDIIRAYIADERPAGTA